MDNNIPKGCKPFDLEKAMAGESVVTRLLLPYKFGAYNPDAKDYKLLGWIDNRHCAHTEHGKYMVSDGFNEYDLFMAAKTQKVWVNLFASKRTGVILSNVYTDENIAIGDSRDTESFIHIKTIETEVEL